MEQEPRPSLEAALLYTRCIKQSPTGGPPTYIFHEIKNNPCAAHAIEVIARILYKNELSTKPSISHS